jgi:hypothetical protein
MARPKDITPLQDLRQLTVRKVLALCREMGRPLARKRLTRAMQLGHLACSVDRRLDRYGKPLPLIARADLDNWLSRPLTRFEVKNGA